MSIHIGLFLQLCLEQLAKPGTLMLVVSSVSIIILLKIIVEPMFAEQESVKEPPNRSSTARFPRPRRTNEPGEFLRLVHAHTPTSITVRVVRWESNAFGDTYPVLRLGFHTPQHDSDSGSPTVEKILEFRQMPTTVASASEGATNIIRQLVAKTQWIGGKAPVRGGPAKQGLISKPLLILLPGDVQAA